MNSVKMFQILPAIEISSKFSTVNEEVSEKGCISYFISFTYDKSRENKEYFPMICNLGIVVQTINVFT